MMDDLDQVTVFNLLLLFAFRSAEIFIPLRPEVFRLKRSCQLLLL